MSLYNDRPIPEGLRKCYWDPAYIAAQPFCITTKLSDHEAQLMSEYEEQCFWENLHQLEEVLKQEVKEQQETGDFDVYLSVVDANKARAKIILSQIEEDLKSGAFQLGFCNTPTSGGLPPKTALNRQDYLTR